MCVGDVVYGEGNRIQTEPFEVLQIYGPTDKTPATIKIRSKILPNNQPKVVFVHSCHKGNKLALRVGSPKPNNPNATSWTTAYLDSKVKVNTKWLQWQEYDTNEWNTVKNNLITSKLDGEIALIKGATIDESSNTVIAVVQFTCESGTRKIPPTWLQPIAQTWQINHQSAKLVKVTITPQVLSLPNIGVTGHTPQIANAVMQIRTNLASTTFSPITSNSSCFVFTQDYLPKQVKIETFVDNRVKLVGFETPISIKALCATTDVAGMFHVAYYNV